MHYRQTLRWITTLVSCAGLALPLMAQDTAGQKDPGRAPDKKGGEAEMMAAMMEMAQPGEKHKLLQSFVGIWSYTTKWWMNPDAAPSESSGTMVTRSVMGGRYLVSDHAGKMQMPGPDGKPAEMEFKGMALEGYDNAKKKYVASWIDNMGTGIMNLEGTYDEATKTLTFLAEYEPMPAMKMKLREVIIMTDADHHRMEFYEDRGGKEVKTMQIDYTRKN